MSCSTRLHDPCMTIETKHEEDLNAFTIATRTPIGWQKWGLLQKIKNIYPSQRDEILVLKSKKIMKSVLQDRKLALKIEQFLLTTIHNNEKLVSAPEDLSEKERSKYV